MFPGERVSPIKSSEALMKYYLDKLRQFILLQKAWILIKQIHIFPKLIKKLIED